jgi:hypothetical protein
MIDTISPRRRNARAGLIGPRLWRAPLTSPPIGKVGPACGWHGATISEIRG